MVTEMLRYGGKIILIIGFSGNMWRDFDRTTAMIGTFRAFTDGDAVEQGGNGVRPFVFFPIP